jgi:hypothetical protein
VVFAFVEQMFVDHLVYLLALQMVVYLQVVLLLLVLHLVAIFAQVAQVVLTVKDVL